MYFFFNKLLKFPLKYKISLKFSSITFERLLGRSGRRWWRDCSASPGLRTKLEQLTIRHLKRDGKDNREHIREESNAHTDDNLTNKNLNKFRVFFVFNIPGSCGFNTFFFGNGRWRFMTLFYDEMTDNYFIFTGKFVKKSVTLKTYTHSGIWMRSTVC